MKKFYDNCNNRIVFVNDIANSDFWDSHWNKVVAKQSIRPVFLNRAVTGPTKKYLGKGARILEGGCGLGQNVWSLHRSGYEAYGVDYAKRTVEKVNEAIPELNVSYGDLRNLLFKDDFFDGYWSLGVIEHFYDGFSNIASEMKRVIRPGGYLFLTFPCISKLRVKKILKGKFEDWKENQELLSNFYQFALLSEAVEAEFRENMFELILKKPFAGFKGLKDEIDSERIRKMMQKMFDSRNYICKAFKWGLDQILSPYCGHMQLLIFRNLK